MTGPATRAALHARYDGPVPPGASISPDADAPWVEQLANRRRWAWIEVRRLGHLMVQARRAFFDTHDIRHHDEWRRLRNRVDHPLQTWALYRDWERAERARLAESCKIVGEKEIDPVALGLVKGSER